MKKGGLLLRRAPAARPAWARRLRGTTAQRGAALRQQASVLLAERSDLFLGAPSLGAERCILLAQCGSLHLYYCSHRPACSVNVGEKTGRAPARRRESTKGLAY